MKEKIGEGRTAEIFALEGNQIAKVFRSHIPKHFIEQELKISKKVEQLGLQVPKVYGVEEIEGKPAIIYERIAGVSFLEVLVKKPWKVNHLARKMAVIHCEIHGKSGEGLPQFKTSLKEKVLQVTELKEEEKEKIIRYLDQLPDQDRLCHGDFHPDNILGTSQGEVVIDWTTAVSGNPLADVARTAMILEFAALPDQIPVWIKGLFRLIRPYLLKNYLHTYMKMTGTNREEIQVWKLPMMAARLIESVPEEEKRVLMAHMEF